MSSACTSSVFWCYRYLRAQLPIHRGGGYLWSFIAAATVCGEDLIHLHILDALIGIRHQGLESMHVFAQESDVRGEANASRIILLLLNKLHHFCTLLVCSSTSS